MGRQNIKLEPSIRLTQIQKTRRSLVTILEINIAITHTRLPSYLPVKKTDQQPDTGKELAQIARHCYAV